MLLLYFGSCPACRVAPLHRQCPQCTGCHGCSSLHSEMLKTCIILTILINKTTTHRVVQATGNLSDIHVSDRNHVTIAGFFDEYVHLPGDHLTLVLHLVAGDEVFPICVVTWKQQHIKCHLQIIKWSYPDHRLGSLTLQGAIFFKQ